MERPRPYEKMVICLPVLDDNLVRFDAEPVIDEWVNGVKIVRTDQLFRTRRKLQRLRGTENIIKIVDL